MGDYAGKKQIELIEKGQIEEAEKWGEGGRYRVALHTLTAALATGSIEGAFAGGTTAVSVPALDRYLEEQGYDETTRGAVLLGFSAAVGSTVGGNTASTVSNVSQTENNYLNHEENARLAKLKAQKVMKTGRVCARNPTCRAERREIDKQIAELEATSKQRDEEFDRAYNDCRAGTSCEKFYYLHVTQRQKLNAEANSLFLQDRANNRLSENWTLIPDSKNAFHNFSADGQNIRRNPDGTYPNVKYVHNNGQLEVIVDRNTGRVITLPSNAGTYNYYPAEGITNNARHVFYDINPWSDFGSGNGDNTTYRSRHSELSGAPFGKSSDNSRYSDHTNRLIIDNSRQNAIELFDKEDNR